MNRTRVLHARTGTYVVFGRGHPERAGLLDWCICEGRPREAAALRMWRAAKEARSGLRPLRPYRSLRQTFKPGSARPARTPKRTRETPEAQQGWAREHIQLLSMPSCRKAQGGVF